MPSTPDTAPTAGTHLRSNRRQLLGRAGLGLGACLLPILGVASTPKAPAGPTDFYANFRGLKLLDEEGRPFDPSTLLGRTVLVNFVFTGCSTICPLQTSALAQVQRGLAPAVRQRFHLLSISIDPLSDSPAALKAYAQRMGVDLSGWRFVTGRHQDIDRVSEALRLFRPGPGVRKPEDHATGLWMIDRKGQLRLRYDGNPPDIQRLLREIPALDQLTATARV